MENILAPIDFSDSSLNAMHFAAALAAHTNAKLCLIHHYALPISTTDFPTPMPMAVYNLVLAVKRQLQELASEVAEKYKIEVTMLVKTKDIVDDIETAANEIKADLVVVATNGQNALLNLLMGSITATLIRRGYVPLLVIPEKVAFKKMKSILYACGQNSTEDPQVALPLVSIASTFDAYVEILHVKNTPERSGNVDKMAMPKGLERIFRAIRHNYVFKFQGNLLQTILDEVNRAEADMIVMNPSHYSWRSNFLHPSNKQKILPLITVPLLVLGMANKERP